MSAQADSLRHTIADRSAIFGVIGQGYVGLPLAVERPIGANAPVIVDNRRALVRAAREAQLYAG